MAIQLRVIQSTVFKQTNEQASQLPVTDKVSVAAGQSFDIHSWKLVGQSYISVALLKDFLGDPPRNTWYVYIPDIDQPPPPSGGLPDIKRLNVPYKSQLDNVLNPTGACNVTSLAMVMTYFQIKGSTSVGQLEDELYDYMESRGLVRGNPEDLATTARNYGLADDFTYRGSLSDMRKAIAEGRPCIIHGNFTSFGHIIVVRGYDPYGFFVNDPYGEWTSSGYRNDLSGENLHYSNRLVRSKCSPEGEDYIWLHRLAKR